MLQVTVLLDNLVRQRGLKAEHGLSLWLDCNGYHILFDAGQSDVYCQNAKALSIDLSLADRLVLSHGHYDHGDGFSFFPVAQADCWPRFFAHPAAFLPRYAATESGAQRSVGLGWQPDAMPGLKDRLMLHTGIMTIAPDTWVCTHICDQVDNQRPSPGFILEKDGQMLPDGFCDEQILISRQEKGLVIICGCCHPGLINTLQCVHRLFPGEHIHAILGGLHLSALDEEEIDGFISALKAFSFDLIIPLHCSGILVRCALHRVFPDRCLLLQTGDTAVF